MTDDHLDAVTYHAADGIATIRLNRRPPATVWTTPVAGLEAAWRRFSASDERVAVLAAAGDKAFTVGADLNDIPHDLYRDPERRRAGRQAGDRRRARLVRRRRHGADDHVRPVGRGGKHDV